jgi:hypothetical protein
MAIGANLATGSPQRSNWESTGGNSPRTDPGARRCRSPAKPRSLQRPLRIPALAVTSSNVPSPRLRYRMCWRTPYEQVDVAVVVVVTAAAPIPARPGHPALAVTSSNFMPGVPQKAVPIFRRSSPARHGRAVGEENVGQAVAIVIEHRHPPAIVSTGVFARSWFSSTVETGASATSRKRGTGASAATATKAASSR